MTKRILVIDDHFETLRLTTLILQRQGYEVDTAQSGRNGIDLALENVPDLVLLDIMMPEMNGLEVCRTFRADAQLKHVPIVMFTARSQIEDKDEAFEAGANDYVVKPMRPKELVGRVESALANYAVIVDSSMVDSAESPNSLPNKKRRTIAIVGANKTSGSRTVAINLAGVFAAPEMTVTHFDLDAKEHRVVMDNVTWHGSEASPNLQSMIETATTDIVIVNVGHELDEMAQLAIKTASDVIVCFAPELVAISDAQHQVEALKPHLSAQAQLHALMLDFSGRISVPIETASNVLRMPVIDAIPIDVEQLETVQRNGTVLISAYPNSESAHKFSALAKSLLGNPVLR